MLSWWINNAFVKIPWGAHPENSVEERNVCLCTYVPLSVGPEEGKKVNLTREIHNYSALLGNPLISYFIIAHVFG